MQTYIFNGTVTAVSQLATCGPALSASVAATETKPIPKFRNGQGEFMYLPGAGFRSKLRGVAALITLEALRAGNRKRFTLNDAQYLRVGGIKQSGAEAIIDTMAMQRMREANPIISCFGASTPWVTGKVSVGNLSCRQPIEPGVFEPMIIDGTRADIMRRNPELVEFLDPNSQTEYSATIERVRANAKTKQAVKTLQFKLRKTTDEESRAKIRLDLGLLEQNAKAQAIVSAQQVLGGYEAIPPGSQLESSLRLVNASALELGCLLAAMEGFAMAPTLGAHIAHGAGEVRGVWTVMTPGGNGAGTVELIPYVGLKISNDELSAAKRAFLDFVATEAFDPYSRADILQEELADEAV